LPGSSTGALVKAVVGNQFERLRDGDRYWFENIYSGRQLAQLDNTTLADIIRRNTTTTNLQNNVFFMQAAISGQIVANVSNGHIGARPTGVPNVLVDLINSDVDVVASTTTGRDGRYQFTKIDETGNYQVRVTAPKGVQLVSSGTQSVAITRGDVVVPGINFGVRLLNRFFGGVGGLADTLPPSAPTVGSGGVSITPAAVGTNSQDASNAAFVQTNQWASPSNVVDHLHSTSPIDHSQPGGSHDAVFASEGVARPSNFGSTFGRLGNVLG
jgi:Animal haem peroxidase/SdrD B-like domain